VSDARARAVYRAITLLASRPAAADGKPINLN
jgi:hypothetical protein